MNKRHPIYLLVLTIAMIVAPAALTGCDVGGPSQAKVVRIGVVYPLSGSLAPTGQALKQAVELAQEIVNQKYDLNLPLAQTTGLPGLGGARIEVVFADHAGDAERGATETQRLIEKEKAVAVLGAYNSSVTARASQVAEAAGIPFLNDSSTSPSLTERGYKWFFRITADDTIFARNFFEFLQEVDQRQGLDTRDIAIVYENSLFGTGVRQMEKTYAKQFNFNIVADVPYAADTKSVQTEVQTLLKTGRPIVMQASYLNDAVLYVRAYKDQGFKPTGLLAMDAGFVSPGFAEAVGKDGDYILSREVWALDLGQKKPLVQQVDALYFKRYGNHLDGSSARAFTGLLTLADAINRAGSTDPQAIRRALLATDLPGAQMIMPWDGIRFDATTGQNTLARGIIVQMKDGVYRTVWPWDIAAEKLVWPIPK